MHVTDSHTDYEAVPLTPTLALIRGGDQRPRLAHVDGLWEEARLLPERRIAERRHTLRTESGRRRADLVSVAHDLELAVLTRKLENRRRFLRDRAS